MTVGSAIKIIRTAKGVTQRALAKKLDVTANYLSLIEGGKREPSLSFLMKLAKALEVPTQMFFMWEGEPTSGVKSADLNQLRELLIRIETVLTKAKDKRRGSRKSAA